MSAKVGHVALAGRGVSMMVLSTLFLTMSDAVAKWLLPAMPAGEIIGIRAVFALLVFWAFLRWRGMAWPSPTARPGGQALNAFLLVVTLYCFTISLAYLDLAQAVLIIYTSPLFVTLLAPLVLREVVGWRRRVAALVGFAGAFLILRPGGDLFQWAALLPIVSALTMAWRDLLLRSLMATEDPLSVLASSMVGLLLLGLVTAPIGFTVPDVDHLLLLLFASFCFLFGHMAMIQGFRLADAALVSPFKYSAIIFAVLVGASIWGEFPDFWEIIGGLLIVGSGLYILHRDILQRRKVPNP